MNFEIDYLDKLAKLLEENSLTELVLEDGDSAITLKKEVNQTVVTAAVPQIAQTPFGTQPQNFQETEETNSNSPKGTPITSPMVGAYYAAPSPGAKPFVKVGDYVSAGQVVCIVEAMKLMNEIETDVSGKVTQICVEDGQSVEYGQVLMYVE